MEEIGSQLTVIALTALLTTAGTWVVARYTMLGGAENDAKARAEAREHDARYLAIRLVCELDPFVYACCAVSRDDGEPGSDGYYTPAEEPPSISLPGDVDWRSLDHELMYRALSFPNDIEAANRSLICAMDYVATPPEYGEYFAQRRRLFSQLGLAANALANDLRRRFQIPNREDRDEDPEADLNNALSQALSDEQKFSGHDGLNWGEQMRTALEGAGVRLEDVKPKSDSQT